MSDLRRIGTTHQPTETIEDAELTEVIQRKPRNWSRAIIIGLGLLSFLLIAVLVTIIVLGRYGYTWEPPGFGANSTYTDESTQIAADLQDAEPPVQQGIDYDAVCNDMSLQVTEEDLFLKNFKLGSWNMTGANVRFTSIAKPLDYNYVDSILTIGCQGSIAVDNISAEGEKIGIEIGVITWRHQINGNTDDILTAYELSEQQVNDIVLIAPNGERATLGSFED